MLNTNLTPEQKAVIYHPFEKHARVLAVAGSGKTTTMAYRIHYLVMEKKVDPTSIRILMFNRLAREQFTRKLTEIDIPLNYQPQVHTFHSFSYNLISEMITRGLLSGAINFWIGDREELVQKYTHRAIENLVTRNKIPPNSIDVNEAVDAIGLWKGSLIPPTPTRAGYRGNLHLPLVYEEFEKLRNRKNALTYADFIPMAVGILESEKGINREWCDQSKFIIVDEYQDVNYGQQRLIELIANQRADVMVVGDDDQTIYEWRGARPSYIQQEFQTVFSNKPHIDYKLSHSFRFGPAIAQCAQNTIEFNEKRIQKPLIAHTISKPASIYISNNSSEQPTNVNKDLAGQIISLVREYRDPSRIIVLGRMFSQLSGLEAEFLTIGVPYRVVGRAPFLERHEIRVLLDYVKLALILDKKVTEQAKDMLMSIANTPNRKLTKKTLARAMKTMGSQGKSTKQVLESLADSPDTPFARKQREQVEDFLEQLKRLQERIQDTDLLAGDLLRWLVKNLDYFQHFENYYGKGENSADRKAVVESFCDYAQRRKMKILDFIEHVKNLDTTRGYSEKAIITMTSVFRTKGLEYDYVIIPNCEEGYMPSLKGTGNAVFDKAAIVKELETSEIIEKERRLFYVAITRAKKGLLIGTSSPPKKGSQSNSSSPKPSRFIYEMQLEPTEKIMGALQRFTAGEKNAQEHLLDTVHKLGGLKKIIKNLVEEYLPNVGNGTLAKEIKKITSRIQAIPFEYPFPYDSSPSTLLPENSQQNKPEPPPWWEEIEF